MVTVYEHALLQMYFSRILEHQRSQRSHWWKYFFAVSKISLVSDEIISYLGLKITEVSVVSDGIIFHVVMNISVVSVDSDKTILHVVSKISLVCVVNDGIISHLVLKTKWSVNSLIKLFSMLSWIPVLSVVSQWWNYFSWKLALSE